MNQRERHTISTSPAHRRPNFGAVPDYVLAAIQELQAVAVRSRSKNIDTMPATAQRRLCRASGGRYWPIGATEAIWKVPAARKAALTIIRWHHAIANARAAFDLATARQCDDLKDRKGLMRRARNHQQAADKIEVWIAERGSETN